MPEKLGKVGEGNPADKKGKIPTGDALPVAIKLSVEATATEGVVIFLGVQERDVQGAWMAGGVDPQFVWQSETVPYGEKVEVDAPLARDLSYFVVLNQDANPLPGPGDLVAGPVALGAGDASLVFVADRTFSVGH